MNTKEARGRLEKYGVVVEGLGYASLPREGFTLDGAFIRNDHAAMLLEAAWHRKWPEWTCEPRQYDGTLVYNVVDTTVADFRHMASSNCRLEAMVLAAEQAAKEDRNAGNA